MLTCENPYCRSTENLTRHHVMPKRYRDKQYPHIKVRNVRLCRDCHTVLHNLKTNFQLALYYNTYEKVINLLVENTMPVVKEDRLVLVPIRSERFMQVA